MGYFKRNRVGQINKVILEFYLTIGKILNKRFKNKLYERNKLYKGFNLIFGKKSILEIDMGNISNLLKNGFIKRRFYKWNCFINK